MNALLTLLIATTPSLPSTFDFSPVDQAKTPNTVAWLFCDEHDNTAQCLTVYSHFYTENPSGICEKNCCRIEQRIRTLEFKKQSDDTWLNVETKTVLTPDGKTEWLLVTPVGAWSTHADPLKLTCDFIEPA